MLLYLSKFDISIFKKTFTECFKYYIFKQKSRYTLDEYLKVLKTVFGHWAYVHLVGKRVPVSRVTRLIYLMMYLCMSLKCYCEQSKLVNWKVLI